MKYVIATLILFGASSSYAGFNPTLMRMVCYKILNPNTPVSRIGDVVVIQQKNTAEYDGRIFGDPESAEYRKDWMTNQVPFELKLFKNTSSNFGVNEDIKEIADRLWDDQSAKPESYEVIGGRAFDDFAFNWKPSEGYGLTYKKSRPSKSIFISPNIHTMLQCEQPYTVDAPVNDVKHTDQSAEIDDGTDPETKL